MTIYEIIKRVMNEYREASGQRFGGHPIKEVFDAISVTFTKELGLSEKYQAKGNFGIGNWSNFPLISIQRKDISTSPMEGYYVVFLFDYEMKKVYLTLNQGYTWFKNNYPKSKLENLEIMANYVGKILNLKKDPIILDPTNFTNDDKIKGYERGAIFSVDFKKEDLNQETLVNETKKVITYLDRLQTILGNNWQAFNRKILDNIPIINHYINTNYDSKLKEIGQLVETQRKAFLTAFPIENLRQMTLEKYCKNGDKFSFSNYIENKTEAICSGFFGNNRNKLFYESNASFVTAKVMNQDEYSNLPTIAEKFEKFKSDIYNLVQNFNRDTYNPKQYLYGANVIKFKSLRLYKPEGLLYGLPSVKKMESLLKYLNLDIPDESDSIQYGLVLTNYLLTMDATLANKRTDIIDALIWDYTSIYVPKNKNDDEGIEVTENEGVKPMNVQHLIEKELSTNNVKQVVLTGAPGTGKTFSAIQYVKTILGDQYAKRNQFVQFHPSFDYTDFVEGIRPKEDKGVMKFVKRDGIFKSFCRNAAADSMEKKYYFIIDEINRADLSKVFGELMFSLEEDYRGPNHRIPTQYQNLPTDGLNGNDVFADGFYIPENVIIIATMNDIDRSVESFDFALRRRFRWINVKVSEILEDTLKSMWGVSLPEGLVERIQKLNQVISDEKGRKLGLDENYQIGPAYFKPSEVQDLEIYLQQIWSTRVEPLIREYVRGRKTDVVGSFITDCHQALLGK